MEAEKQDGWLQRNWKWLIAAGCGVIVCFVIAIIVFAFGIVTAVFGVLRSSDVYVEAVAIAREDPAVQSALGTPIEEGWLVGGTIETTGSGGEASLNIPLSGPLNSGTLYVEADRRNGVWHYQTLEFVVDGLSEPIVLTP